MIYYRLYSGIPVIHGGEYVNNKDQIAILKAKHILVDNGKTIISCTSGMSEGVSVIALEIGMSKDDSVFTYLSVSCAIQFAKYLLDSLLKSATGESYAPIQIGTLYLKNKLFLSRVGFLF